MMPQSGTSVAQCTAVPTRSQEPDERSRERQILTLWSPWNPQPWLPPPSQPNFCGSGQRPGRWWSRVNQRWRMRRARGVWKESLPCIVGSISVPDRTQLRDSTKTHQSVGRCRRGRSRFDLRRHAWAPGSRFGRWRRRSGWR